jgi:hypothetical protein
MAAYWNSTDEGERVRAIDKYDAARLSGECPRADRGRLPDQDVPRVIALRNWSVHYRPQSYSHDEPDLRAKVEDAGFPHSPERAHGRQQQPVVPR